MSGLSNMTEMRALLARVDDDWESVQRDLETIRGLVLRSEGAIINVTADEKALHTIDNQLASFAAGLPRNKLTPQDWSVGKTSSLLLPRENELLVVPTQVNYVCQSTNLFTDAGYTLDGSSLVISKYLSSTWLWDRVRVSGGAYGGFCNFDIHTGMFQFMSYRDPNLMKTVECYEGSADFLRASVLRSSC